MAKKEFEAFIGTIKKGGTIEQATTSAKKEVAKTTKQGIKIAPVKKTVSKKSRVTVTPSGVAVITEDMMPKYGEVSREEVLSSENKEIARLFRQKSRLETQRSGFDPETSYVYTHESGIPVTALGKTIRWKYYDKPIKNLETVISKRQEFKKDILDLPDYVDISRTQKGYIFKEDTQKKAKMEWDEASLPQKIAKGLFVGVTQWPRTVTEGLTSIVTREPPSSRGYAESLIAWESGTWGQAKTIHKGGSAIPFIRSTVTSPAITHVALPLTAGVGAGLGIGAIKGVSITAAKIAEVGLVSYGGYKIIESGIQDPVETFSTVLLTTPIAMMGYSTGHRIGFGRTEAFLYGRRTYKVGSSEHIRFNEALKIGRHLENVSSKQIKSLDFAKDIMRMDTQSAQATMKFLTAHPKTVIGGSSASYTQVYGARMPRDLDLLVKDVPLAKTKLAPYLKTKGGEHLIDIHGFDFGGKGGVYHRFGFETQSPKKLGDYLFMRAGEQTFRKGIAGTKIETQYRWFKDIPDFITHSKSQITMAKLSYNPFTRVKGFLAEKHLARFIDPSISPSYGKQPSFLSRSITNMTRNIKVTEPLGMVKRGGGIVDYIYPKGTYPVNIVFNPVYSGYAPLSRQGGYTAGFKPISIPQSYNIPSRFERALTPSVIKGIDRYSKGPTFKTPPLYIPTPSIPESYPAPKIPSYTWVGSYPAPVIRERYLRETKTPYFPALGKSDRRLPSYTDKTFSLKYMFREFKIPETPRGFNF